MLPKKKGEHGYDSLGSIGIRLQIDVPDVVEANHEHLCGNS